MLFLHETHEVRGQAEEAFDAAYREGWMKALSAGPNARLLYYLRQAHGTGPSYRVVTITALQDAATWEQMAERVHGGDLASLARSLDELRHESVAKLLVPLPWSPWQSIDLDRVPTDGRTQRPSLFMEDTVWPFEQKLDEYIERSGSHYAREMRDTEDAGRRILTVDASFRTAFGNGLGVICGDFDTDGWTDVFVANDGTVNQLWSNQEDGTFQDTALRAGVAVDLQVYEGGHGPRRPSTELAVLQQNLDWFCRTLAVVD